MTRGILIAGNKSALCSAIMTEAGRRVEQYVLAAIPDRLSADAAQTGLQSRQEDAKETPCALLDWNPGSPISARTLVIAAENRLGRIDEAILVCDPPPVRCAATDISLANVEMLANDNIKSWFFLIKELAAIFKAREKGTLALAYSEPSAAAGKEEIIDLLGSTAAAAFRSLTRSLLAASYAEPYLTLGFSAAETGDESGFASFIFKQLDDTNRRSNGKLHKYGKLGLFR